MAHETAIDDDISLGKLLSRSLAHSDTLLESATIDRVRLVSLLANLDLCERLNRHLGVISTNEELQDISTQSLPCLLVPYYRALLTLQLKSTGSVIRQEHLAQALQFFQDFVSGIQLHRILEPLPNVLSLSQNVADPATRRNNKIQMYRKEKELKAALEHLKSESNSTSTPNENLAEQSEESQRKTTLLQMELAYLKAHAEIDATSYELELLKATIPMSDLPHNDPSSSRSQIEDTSWRLDGPNQTSKRSWFDPNAGPVMTGDGKILRPFTITSASASLADTMQTRLKLTDEVFRPSHRLPTMTIDEFLDNEFASGRVLQGGEADAQRQDEASRKRKELVEMDNLEGYQAGEYRLGEERQQDDYRDTHRRGDGNRIGRG